MKRFLVVLVIFSCGFTTLARESGLPDDKKFPSLLPNNSETVVAKKLVDSVYKKLKLDSAGLKKDVFYYAYKGYQYLLSKGMLAKTDILTICDYSQSSAERRLYVLNLATGQILYHTFVSHGKNSGKEYATSFSNLKSSHKSSLGFMVTAETYRGKSGYSMRFDGVEPNINDNVRPRDIVMHGSWYVNEERADDGQPMGRSYGCPAVPYAEHDEIINAIKDGSCFFIYNPDVMYSHRSQIMNAKFEWPALSKQTIASSEQNNSQPVPATPARPGPAKAVLAAPALHK